MDLKPALLVVDIQNVWLDESKDMKKCVEDRVDAINDATRWFRKHKLPVIVIYHQDKKEGPPLGSKAFEFLDSIAVKGTDIKVTKNYPNAFCKTDLEAIVRKHGCDTVIISGISATWCVMGTYFGAIDCDLQPYLLKGGVASNSEEGARFAERVCGTKTLQEIEKAL